MAVNRRLRSRNAPPRMVPAMFGIAETPVRATGNWYHRLHGVYGTEPIPTPLPQVAVMYPIPPGPTTGHSAATGPFGYFTFSAIYPALPRHFNTAGTLIHPNTTAAVAGPPTPNHAALPAEFSRHRRPLGRSAVLERLRHLGRFGVGNPQQVVALAGRRWIVLHPAHHGHP